MSLLVCLQAVGPLVIHLDMLNVYINQVLIFGTLVGATAGESVNLESSDSSPC